MLHLVLESASEQGSPTTPPFYKELAANLRELTGFDFAPEQIREILKGYLPMVGAATKLPNLGDVFDALVDTPAKEQLGRETDTPFVKRFVAGGNAYAVETAVSELAKEGLALEKRENTAEAKSGEVGFKPAEAALKELYDQYVEQMKGFQQRNAALTRQGVPKDLGTAERRALNEERRQVQAEFARAYNDLKTR